jgi:hypothetical protein
MLVDLLDRAFDKRSWHGANLISAIRGVHADQARRSVGGRKTIWEQLLHAAYWKNVVIKFLSGESAFDRKGSNWLKMPQRADERAWKEDVLALKGLHVKLRAIVSKLPEKKLNEKNVWLIQGAAFHDIYHAGQIKLLRKMMK